MKINCMNSNGTASVTIPKKIMEGLGWNYGDDLKRAVVKTSSDSTMLGIMFFKEETNGYKLKVPEKATVLE